MRPNRRLRFERGFFSPEYQKEQCCLPGKVTKLGPCLQIRDATGFRQAVDRRALNRPEAGSILIQDAILKLGADDFQKRWGAAGSLAGGSHGDLRALRVLVRLTQPDIQVPAAGTEGVPTQIDRPKNFSDALRIFLENLLLETGDRAQANRPSLTQRRRTPMVSLCGSRDGRLCELTQAEVRSPASA